MPEHPMAVMYVWGALLSLLIVAGLMAVRPWTLDLLADDAKIPRAAFVAALAIAYGPFWPITWMVALAHHMIDRRG